MNAASETKISLREDDDYRFMAAALRIGTRELGQTWPNPAVGALVVRNGEIVGSGWTRRGGRPHAEPIALAEAGEAARGATLYVGLEPCSHFGKTPPCVNAIIAAGVGRVVSAMEDPNPLVGGQGYEKLRGAGIPVLSGVLESEARRIHSGHIKGILKKQPYVTVKMAISANKKAGLVGRRPAAITGLAVRDRVHLMRARTDAIAVGIGTVLADDPMLTCRLAGMEDRSPVRVVFDSFLRTPLSSSLVRSAGKVPVWIVAAEDADKEAEQRLMANGVDVIRVSRNPGKLDLSAAMHALSNLGITRLMVEGGPILADALLKADLADEAVIFESPSMLGNDATPALSGPADVVMKAAGLDLTRTSRVGDDTAFFYERA